MSLEGRIILALDLGSGKEALSLVERFSNTVKIFKVGLELFSASGPSIVREIKKRGCEVFLDLKFHDIPNTVSRASLQALDMGVSMLTLHASGGREMIKRASEGLIEASLKRDIPRPRIIAVTVLTSIGEREFKTELGYAHSLRTQVKHLAKLAIESGADGVVASGREVGMLRKHLGSNVLIVTPGIRPSWMPPDDQKRRVTPKEALRAGADYIVVGRAVLGQEDPEKALELLSLEVLSL